MINHGFDLYAKTYNNATIFHLDQASEDSNGDSQAYTKLLYTIATRLNDVDIDLGDGNKVVDILISNSEFTNKAVALTNDELFYFFKEDADLFKLSKNPDKTYVAISHGDGFWSTGAWSLARNLVKTHPDTTFYLVKDEMLTKGGDEFLKQFDAIISPGAGDSFPSDMPEFTKQDTPMIMDLERHYQNMLDKSYQLDIPYLGICAGAQHFSMYHGGSIKPVRDYAGEKKHQITFIKGTLAHFMSLTKDQQLDLLETCSIPDVTVHGDTAHHYAAVNDKLGLGLELGAVSEENYPLHYHKTNAIYIQLSFNPNINKKNKKHTKDRNLSSAIIHLILKSCCCLQFIRAHRTIVLGIADTA
jgi:gamma-glutamyl-gamma-aminobutyrate hydrolase PuuD